MSRDQLARNDIDDRVMVQVAQLALDLMLPSQSAGTGKLTRLDRDEHLLRSIFEKAVADLYRHELHGMDGWRIQTQKALSWQKTALTPGLAALLPSMTSDIMLHHGPSRRIVLDTKFTNIVTSRQFGGVSFKSKHVYQLYAYLRSQAGAGDVAADNAEGILPYPALSQSVDEAVMIQGTSFGS